MYLGEVAFVPRGNPHARGTVRLVADDEVEHAVFPARLRQDFLLRGRYRVYGLVSGKDHHEAVVVTVSFQLRGDGFRVRARGQGQVHHAVHRVVRVIPPLPRCRGVGTDADGLDGLLRIGVPGVEGLPQQGNAWHHEQHQSPAAKQLFHDKQRRVGLSRPAGHDELAAVVAVLDVMPVRGGYGIELVLVRLLPLHERGIPRKAVRQLLPVHGRGFEVGHADARDGRVLVADGFLGVASPPGSGGNPHAVGKAHSPECHFVGERPAGSGEERIHDGLVYHRPVGIALTLYGPIVARFCPGHEVDARVRAAEVLAAWEILPHPYLLKPVVAWVGQQP